MRAAVTPEHARANTETRSLLRDRYHSPSQSVSEDAGPYGHSVTSTTAGPSSYASASALAETTGSIQCVASRTPVYQGRTGLCNSPGHLEELSLDGIGRGHGHGLQKEGCHDGRHKHRLGGAVRGQTDLRPLVESRSRASNCLEKLAVCRPCHFFLPDLKGHHVLIRSDNVSVVSYINHQGGLSSKRLFTLVKHLLEWAQCNLRTLKAVHIPGILNRGADM